MSFELAKECQVWWYMPLITALQEQADLCEKFEASLVYVVIQDSQGYVEKPC